MAINIPIISEFKDAGLKKAGKDIETFSAKSRKAFDGLASAGRKLSLGVAAVGAAAVAVGKSLVTAGETASTSNARIEQIAASMGLFNEEMTGTTDGVAEVTKRLVKLAEATARNTGLDQNAIKATQAKLLTFKELAQTADQVGAEFDRATKAAIDLAAAGFGSAEQNAVQLGKALNDPIKGLTSLSRSGVTFTETEKERIKTLVESNRVSEAQQLILQAIETQVGGTAEATANASDKMKVAFSQAQERLGQALLPAFEKLATFVVESVIPALERFYNRVMPALTDTFNRARDAIVPLVQVMADKLRPIVERITNWLKQNTDVVKVFFAVLAGAAVIAMLAALAASIVALVNPFTVVVVAAAALAAGVYYLWTNFETFRNIVTTVMEVVKTVVKIAVEFVMGWFNALRNVVTGFIKILQGIFQGDLSKVMEGFKQLFSGAIAAVVQFFIGMPRAIFNNIGGALTNLGRDMVGAIVNGIKSAAGNIGSAILGAIPGGGAIAGAIGGVGGAVKKIFPFAEGGIVTGPTLGLVGEAGPEAIIPLDRLSSVTGGGGITINVAGTVITERDLVEQIRVGLLRSQRDGKQLVA
jgi:phage-related protein